MPQDDRWRIVHVHQRHARVELLRERDRDLERVRGVLTESVATRMCLNSMLLCLSLFLVGCTFVVTGAEPDLTRGEVIRGPARAARRRQHGRLPFRKNRAAQHPNAWFARVVPGLARGRRITNRHEICNSRRCTPLRPPCR